MGKFSSTIILDRKNGKWLMTSKTGKESAVIIATPESLALGTHTLEFQNDECTSKLADKEVTITLTHCTLQEFPCKDGHCVPMLKESFFLLSWSWFMCALVEVCWFIMCVFT